MNSQHFPNLVIEFRGNSIDEHLLAAKQYAYFVIIMSIFGLDSSKLFTKHAKLNMKKNVKYAHTYAITHTHMTMVGR